MYQSSRLLDWSRDNMVYRILGSKGNVKTFHAYAYCGLMQFK